MFLHKIIECIEAVVEQLQVKVPWYGLNGDHGSSYAEDCLISFVARYIVGCENIVDARTAIAA
jgi:hypothetical protein